MSSDKYCCVPGCRESGGMHKVLHGFPNPEKEQSRFNAWVYAVSGNILEMSNEFIHKYRRVCRSHFEEKYLCRNNRVSNAAVPTLNLAGPTMWTKYSSSFIKKPLKEIQNQDVSELSSVKDVGPLHHCIMDMKALSVENLELQKENIDPKSRQMHRWDVQSSQISIAKHTQTKPDSEPQEHRQNVPLPNIPLAVNIRSDSDLEQQECRQRQEDVPPSLNNSLAENMQSNTEVRSMAKKNTRRLYLNDNERQLHMKLVATKNKLSKVKNKMKKQLAEIKAAKKLATSPAVLDTIKHFSSTAKMLMQIQWRENKKKEKGRRFTLREKIVALSILKQSPRGYKFFRKIFILPAPQTLVKLVQQSNLHPGVNKNIFSQLKKKTSNMSREAKLCVLLFDEVSLKPQITFGERKDKVTGFIDDGQHRKPEFADHAQVFMVRGLITNYKQPVAYTFSASATKGPELAKQIKSIVTEIQKAGLIVVASVCDQGTNNRQALRLLLDETRGVYLRRGEEPKENVILINEQEIVPLYDPPHLLKGLRNNLLTKDLKYVKEGKVSTAKWSHLQLLLKENPGYKGVKMLPKLTENHVNPEKINKMKVKLASQIFSQTVGSNMGYLADKGILPKECEETADLLLFVDNIFDSVNGSYKKNKYAKPLLRPATPISPHKKTWSEAKKIFQTMKYVTAEGKHECVPTIANWIWTLEGLEVLLKNLQDNFDITSVWLRHLNQDPLENFFGAVRSHGCRNVNPTCDQFEAAFCTLLINSINSVQTRGKNCEDDFCDALHTLVVNEANEKPTSACHTVDFDNILNINFTPLEEKEKDPRKIAPLQYISGYFLMKAKRNIFKDCENCKIDLINNEEIEYIKYREYAGRRWLCTPSNELIKLISKMQDILNEILKNNLEKNYLNEVIKTAIIILIDFDFIKCNNHKEKLIDYLIKIVNRCMIFNYCKQINKILAGKVVHIDDESDKFQVKAKKYNRKCFKRKL